MKKTLKRLASLRLLARINELDDELRSLRREVDTLKSSLGVPASLLEEFWEWKRNDVIPPDPLVSVCVATYNRAELLTERCIPSVLDQSYPNLELIVVGDACDDDTAERIARIGDPRVRFTNLLERGVYPQEPFRRWLVAGTAPANVALASVRGDFVTHLDDDDEFLPDRLEKLVGFALRERLDFVWHPFWQENPDGSWRLAAAEHLRLGQVTTSSVLYRSWFARIPWDVEAYRMGEPGDWNRFRRIAYITSACGRYPEPLLRHYRERARSGAARGERTV